MRHLLEYSCLLSVSVGLVSNWAVGQPTGVGNALNAPQFPWNASGDLTWGIATNATPEGNAAVWSGGLPGGIPSPDAGTLGTAGLETFVIGPGVVTFSWMVSAAAKVTGGNAGVFGFGLDGTNQASISGSADWGPQSVTLSPGVHRLQWGFTTARHFVVTPGSITTVYDGGAAYLANVQAEVPLHQKPVIVVQPASQLANLNASVTFAVVATANDFMTYQWLKTGIPVDGATNTSLAIPHAQASDLALYSATVSSSGGISTSAEASLKLPLKFSTLAGTPLLAGFLEDQDGTGAAARFVWPVGVGVDDTGNIYVAESKGQSIRKVTPQGKTTTLAGPGGVALPNGNATPVNFSNPTGITVDGAGNVYVTDSDLHIVQKVSPAGTVSTFAGLISKPGSADGPRGKAQFNQPSAVAVDTNGIMYVADWGNYTIRKITQDGSVSTIAGLAGKQGTSDGTGNAARFLDLEGIVVDPTGIAYVADADVIRKISPDGSVTTLSGLTGDTSSTDSFGRATPFSSLQGIAVDSKGNLYVSDNGSTIRTISPEGTVTTIAGSPNAVGWNDGTGSAVSFDWAAGLAMDRAGNLYVADVDNGVLRKGAPFQNANLVVQAQRLDPGRVQVRFRHMDGSLPLDLSRVSIQWRDELPSGMNTTWQSIAAGFQTDGNFVILNDPTGAELRRFYRVVEQ